MREQTLLEVIEKDDSAVAHLSTPPLSPASDAAGWDFNSESLKSWINHNVVIDLADQHYNSQHRIQNHLFI